MHNKTYYISQDMPYVYEDNLYKCGCGGNPLINYRFDYDSCKFKETEIYCKECGMSTGIRDNIDEAINVWQECFDETNYHRNWCQTYNDDYDKCLGCSGGFLDN